MSILTRSTTPRGSLPSNSRDEFHFFYEHSESLRKSRRKPPKSDAAPVTCDLVAIPECYECVSIYRAVPPLEFCETPDWLSGIMSGEFSASAGALLTPAELLRDALACNIVESAYRMHYQVLINGDAVPVPSLNTSLIGIMHRSKQSTHTRTTASLVRYNFEGSPIFLVVQSHTSSVYGYQYSGQLFTQFYTLHPTGVWHRMDIQDMGDAEACDTYGYAYHTFELKK